MDAQASHGRGQGDRERSRLDKETEGGSDNAKSEKGDQLTAKHRDSGSEDLGISGIRH